MAYTIKLGTFSKLENSTAQPVTTGWAEYSIVFKEGAEISQPTITLQADLSTVAAYNYAVWGSRYYWIMTKTMLRTDICQMTLKIDVLATYKSQIGAASLYVLRAAGASDGNIVDRLYPTSSISYGRSDDPSFIPGGYGSGQYIVNCVGMTTTGGSTLWKFTPDNFRAMLYALYNKIDGFQVSDILDAVSKFLDGSPEKMVSSAMWMPPYNFTSSSQRFYVGTWDTEITANLITDPIFSLVPIELTLPKHPQSATRGSFLNLAPYSTYTLNIPLFGAVNLDTTAIKDAASVYISITIDALSGQGRCRVYSGGNPSPLLADLTAQIGVPVPLQGQNAGATIAGGIVSTLGSVIGAIASKGALTPVLGAATAGIDTAISALSGASFSTGSSGGALASRYNITLDATFLHLAAEDNTHRGRPLCDVRTISTLSGYILVADGDVSIPGPLPEELEVKNYLESGFFYE